LGITTPWIMIATKRGRRRAIKDAPAIPATFNISAAVEDDTHVHIRFGAAFRQMARSLALGDRALPQGYDRSEVSIPVSLDTQ
jgi:hypothetical protein